MNISYERCELFKKDIKSWDDQILSELKESKKDIQEKKIQESARRYINIPS